MFFIYVRFKSLVRSVSCKFLSPCLWFVCVFLTLSFKEQFLILAKDSVLFGELAGCAFDTVSKNLPYLKSQRFSLFSSRNFIVLESPVQFLKKLGVVLDQ